MTSSFLRGLPGHHKKKTAKSDIRFAHNLIPDSGFQTLYEKSNNDSFSDICDQKRITDIGPFPVFCLPTSGRISGKQLVSRYPFSSLTDTQSKNQISDFTPVIWFRIPGYLFPKRITNMGWFPVFCFPTFERIWRNSWFSYIRFPKSSQKSNYR